MTGSRLSALFRGHRTAFLPYMTVGLPSPDSSVDVFKAMADAGADGFELGIPYSDPLMDGPVIQTAGRRAIDAGTNLERAFGLIARITAETGLPNLVMTYVNPVMRQGIDVFFGRLADAGVDGVILPDVPLEELGPFFAAAAAHGIEMVAFLAPTSDDARIAAVADAKPVFIYGVADLGVTGERTAASEHARVLSGRVRAVTDIPLVLGVGISTPEQAADASSLADGIIVGTALVREVTTAPDTPTALTRLAERTSAFRDALR